MHIHANKLDEAEFDRAKKDPSDLSWSLALFVTMRCTVRHHEMKI